MKNSLWIIVVIIVAFISFLVGYSRPHSAKKVYPTTTSSIAAPAQAAALVTGKTPLWLTPTRASLPKMGVDHALGTGETTCNLV